MILPLNTAPLALVLSLATLFALAGFVLHQSLHTPPNPSPTVQVPPAPLPSSLRPDQCLLFTSMSRPSLKSPIDPSLPVPHPLHPSCNHPIYCSGPLLHAVQTSNIFYDSKTFVDMPLRFKPDIVLQEFSKLPPRPVPEQLQHFLHDHFYPVDHEVLEVMPADWVEVPRFLQDIANKESRLWALSLHQLWRPLFRTYNHQGLCEDCYSSIPLPHPFVIPGGRFKEYYYWDTYWIMKGLLVSGMKTSARLIVENLAYLVNMYGFVPNGGRIYYLNRSQPPLLTRMVSDYYDETHDEDFLRRMLPSLDKEYEHWMTHRSFYLDFQGRRILVNHFNVTCDAPRPEAYVEDLYFVKDLRQKDRAKVFSHMASGAEFGWDYSSRWFAGNHIQRVGESHLIPVSLNSLLYSIERSLESFHSHFGNTSKAQYYAKHAQVRFGYLDALFWNDTEHCWKDFNANTGGHPYGFYVSTIIPLLCNSHSRSVEDLTDFVQYLRRMFAYECGIPTSDYCSGQQWDFPNAWAPLQHGIIRAMDTIADLVPEAGELATQLAHQWLSCNYCGWKATGGMEGGVMFEKYDVLKKGIPGGGGEYLVQVGFGWTNGVALDLLKKYGASFVPSSCPHVDVQLKRMKDGWEDRAHIPVVGK